LSEGGETETIRWPTNLDRKAIEVRLGKVAAKAAALELSEIEARFANVATLSAAQIASSVVSSLTWIFNQPEHERVAWEAITKELEMVALNLKNLK
jgi:hypothetical protein